MEAEKKDLQQEVDELDIQLEDFEKTHAERDDQAEKLSNEIRVLASQLSLKDRKLHDLETKLLKIDQDLDVKLANATKELNASKQRIEELSEENRSVRQQLSQLSSTSTGYEDLVHQNRNGNSEVPPASFTYAAGRIWLTKQRCASSSLGMTGRRYIRSCTGKEYRTRNPAKRGRQGISNDEGERMFNFQCSMREGQ